MKNRYRRSQASEISGAMAFLEQNEAHCPVICTLFCEELLSRLIESGYQDISNAVMQDCTVVMVAHRLNTLRKVNRIYRIEDGKTIPCALFEETVGQKY